MKKRNLIILICIIAIIVSGYVIYILNHNQLLIGGVSYTVVKNEYVFMTIK